MKVLIALLFLLGLLLVAGCSESESTPLTGAVVSEIKTQPQPVVPEVQKVACKDECSADTCNDIKFVKCDQHADGCKRKAEIGLTMGKCGIQCLSDKDCGSNKKCSANYDCKEIEVVTYVMGESIRVDDLLYKVTKAESFASMGSSVFKKETTGEFIKAYLDVTNAAKQTQQVFTPRFNIVDSQDRKYDRVADDILYIADGFEFGKQLQPDLTASGAVVFEMPKDATDLVLVVRGDWLSTSEVRIKLNTIRAIGTDRTMQEKQDKMMDEAMAEGERMMEEAMNKCNSPFKCSSNCAKYSDVGQKDCPSGQVCCMTEQSEVDAQMQDYQKQMDELLKQYG